MIEDCHLFGDLETRWQLTLGAKIEVDNTYLTGL